MDKVIEIRDLWFRYKKDLPWILKGINIGIRSGELIAIIGQNGCGKTTLVKHLNGLLKPTKGDVIIHGTNTRAKETYELAKLVGYVFQFPDSQIFSRTLFNEVSFGPKNLGFSPDAIKKAVDSSLERVHLRKDLSENPQKLSSGEKERLAIADILAMMPEIIIFDEPTSGQDYSTCEVIMKIARELASSGITVLIISHDMDLVAKWCDRILLMSEGRIVKDGFPEEIFTDFNLLGSVEIDPLQVSLLAKSFGFREIPITVDGMAKLLRKEYL
jgi:energy-coupling factor transporter ATP-binding protein EcfA2